MTTPDVPGLGQLERAVLDESASLATALRRCLMVAGYACHEELRTWALKELEGYALSDNLPDYRRVPAALMITLDLHLPGTLLQNNTRRISPQQLPEHARDRGIAENAPVVQGVRELEAAVARSEASVCLSPPGAAEYAILMTKEQHQHGNQGAEITSVYWDVPIQCVEGVVDRIRTRLTQFVAEVRAAMPPGQQDPDPSQIDAAAQQALSITAGDHATVHVAAPYARADRGATAHASVNEPTSAPPQPWWHRTSVIWTAVGALAAIASAIVGIIVAT